LSLEQETLQAARNRAEAALEAARTDLSNERTAASGQLQQSAADLSREIATTVLGRSMGSN